MIKKVIILAVFTLFLNSFSFQFSTTHSIQKGILARCILVQFHQIEATNPVQLDKQLILTRCGI